MTKLDGAALLAEAEKNGQIYPIKPGWRKFMYFAGVLMCLLVITIPLGIWFFLMAPKCRLGITKEGFAIKWFTTNAYAWSDIESFVPVPLHFHAAGGGLVGALISTAASAAVAAKTQGLKGPLQFKVKGKWGYRQIPAHAIQNSLAMVEEMERQSGLVILPKEQAA